MHGSGAWSGDNRMTANAPPGTPVPVLNNEQLTQMVGSLSDRIQIHENEIIQLKGKLTEKDKEIETLTTLARNTEAEAGKSTIEVDQVKEDIARLTREQRSTDG